MAQEAARSKTTSTRFYSDILEADPQKQSESPNYKGFVEQDILVNPYKFYEQNGSFEELSLE